MILIELLFACFAFLCLSGSFGLVYYGSKCGNGIGGFLVGTGVIFAAVGAAFMAKAFQENEARNTYRGADFVPLFDQRCDGSDFGHGDLDHKRNRKPQSGAANCEQMPNLIARPSEVLWRLRHNTGLIARRDSEWNLFNCVSGGYIRQELKQILEE